MVQKIKVVAAQSLSSKADGHRGVPLWGFSVRENM